MDKIQIGQNLGWTKSRMDKNPEPTSKIQKLRNDSVLSISIYSPKVQQYAQIGTAKDHKGYQVY